MKTKPKILFIITKSEVGGAQKYVCEQMAITADHFDSYLACNQPGWLTDATTPLARDILMDVRIEKKASLSYLFRLVAFLRRHKIDLVICNSANGGLYGRIAAFITGIKAVYVSHGWSSIYNGGRIAFLFNFVERILAYLSSAVICVSDTDATKAQSIGIPGKKLKVLKNAIFPVKSHSIANKHPKGGLNLLTVSRLDHPKRPDLLILASSRFKNLRLVIVGAGSQREYLENIIRENDIKNVEMWGERKNFSDFCDFDAFALISESEGLPLSALEAMSAGLPLILSNVGGCHELVNKNGVLVNNTVEEIVEGITTLMGHYEQFQKDEARVFATQYNLENTKDKFIHFYQTLIKGKQ